YAQSSPFGYAQPSPFGVPYGAPISFGFGQPPIDPLYAHALRQVMAQTPSTAFGAGAFSPAPGVSGIGQPGIGQQALGQPVLGQQPLGQLAFGVQPFPPQISPFLNLTQRTF